jgi:asparagine synthase (glutamine-hydrolysing)
MFTSIAGMCDQSAATDGQLARAVAALRIADTNLSRAPGPRVFIERGVPTGGLIIAADARLDNAGQLRETLQLEPLSSQEAIVAAAYRRWPSEWVRHLIGDFAVAIWDGALRQLTLACDPLGIRSLFYADQGTRFTFSSELTALLRMPELDLRPDDVTVAHFLAAVATPPGRTFYSAIRRVPPAHSVTWRNGHTSVRRQYSFGDAPDVRFRRDEDYVDHYREVLTKAVSARCGTDAAAVALSGGLDSSSVLALAAEHPPRGPLMAISAVPHDCPECDERARIQSLVTRLAVPSAVITEQGSADVDAVMKVSAEPPFIGMHPLLWNIAAEARRRGATRLLTGYYGDLVGGYDRALLVELIENRRWAALAGELGRYSRRSAAATVLLAAGLRATRLRFIPALRHRARARRSYAAHRVLRDDLARASGALDAVERTWSDDEVVRTDSRRGLQLLLDRVAPHETDAAERYCRAFGIEPTHPFSDRRLVELSVGLPTDQRRRHGMARFVLRQAMQNRLPDSIRLQSKTYYDSFYGRYLTAFAQALAPHVHWTSIDDYVDRPRLDRLRNASDRVSTDLLWRCTALGYWMTKTLQRHPDGHS